jgi:Resolvase, N terminal domain
MSIEGQTRVAYYLRVSTESQELHNQRTEILPFIDRRGWKLVHSFEDLMSGRKSEKDRPGFAAMLKAAHQRKFDISRSSSLTEHHKKRVQLLPDVHDFPTEDPEAWRSFGCTKVREVVLRADEKVQGGVRVFLPEQLFIHGNC